MKIKNEKVISMMLIVCFFTTLVFGTVFAGQTIPGVPTKDKSGNEIVAAKKLNEKLGEIIGVMFWIATAVCVGKLMHIGILFMMTAANSKAKAQEAVLPWLIGAIICGGFATIGPLVIGIFQDPLGGDVLDIGK